MDNGRARDGEGPGERRSRDAAGNGRLAAAVYAELERLGDHVARSDRPHPFALVAGDGRIVAANRPLLELLGGQGRDVLGSRWEGVMPAWGSRDHRDAPDQFDADLFPPGRDELSALVPTHVWVYPIADADGVLAHTLLLTPHPDTEC